MLPEVTEGAVRSTVRGAQTREGLVMVNVGVGFTVMVKDWGGPVHPLAEGVMVMIAMIGLLVELVAVNDGILPLPLAASPMAVLLFVQLNAVPETVSLKLTEPVVVPLQTVWSGGSLTVGVGFTVKVKDWGVPVHPLAVGVTVMVAMIGLLVELVAANDAILPLPLAASPMAVLLFVQLNAVPETVSLKLTEPVVVPLQTVWSGGSLTVGVGFTVMVKDWGGPVHPLAEGVMVMIAMIGLLVELVAVNDGILPLPLAASPMAGLLFVQLNAVPETVSLKLTEPVVVPLQTVWSGGSLTVGVGFTVKVKDWGVPVHPLAVGVTVMVAMIGLLVELMAANDAILPLPLAASPMAVLLFVQVNVGFRQPVSVKLTNPFALHYK